MQKEKNNSRKYGIIISDPPKPLIFPVAPEDESNLTIEQINGSEPLASEKILENK